MSSSSRSVPRSRVLRDCVAVNAFDVLPRLEGSLPSVEGFVADGPMVEDARAAGFDQGYQDGFARGVEDARESAARELDEERAALRAVVSLLHKAIDRAEETFDTSLAALEDRLVGAAFELVEALLQRELALTTSPGRDALARALALAPPRGALQARLHPDDAHLLDPVDDLAAGRELVVVADPSVAPGDCLLVAGAAEIDASLGEALARVRKVFGVET